MKQLLKDRLRKKDQMAANQPQQAPAPAKGKPDLKAL
jgi:hypothetical protein